MTEINKIGINLNQIYKYNEYKNNKKKKDEENNSVIKERKDKLDINNEEKNKNNSINKNYSVPDSIKRPIKINKNNSTFFINYKGKNKKVDVKPGKYTLTEINLTIKDQVNEKFGINKVKLKLTGTISDRLIYAEENEDNKLLIQK